MTTAKLNTSELVDTALSRMTSGALQRGLVTRETASVLAGPSMQDRPKSAIFTCSRGLSLLEEQGVYNASAGVGERC